LNIQTDSIIDRHLSPSSPEKQKIIFKIISVGPNLVKISDFRKTGRPAHPSEGAR